MSQQITLSGLDAKNPSKIGLMRLQGPHQVAPILSTIRPGLFWSRRKKSSLDLNCVMIVFCGILLYAFYKIIYYIFAKLFYFFKSIFLTIFYFLFSLFMRIITLTVYLFGATSGAVPFAPFFCSFFRSKSFRFSALYPN